ncbi:MAG: hypothetical protein DRQ13_05445 [Ignavibacteriae bacterium]|nr:MAG: hypothetical protein DRQ13_05445 [Ignavibacteriota bacterium]
MSFKNLMLIKAITCLVFGILLLAIPGKLLSIFGATLSDGGMFTAREYGAALFGNLFLCWFARNAAESDTRKAIIVALFIYDLIGFIGTAITVVVGVLNPFGWLLAFVYLFFTLGFGYFFVKSPDVKGTLRFIK